MPHEFYKLMLVTHRLNTPLPEYLNFIKKCLCSGVSSVQLREKSATAAFKLEFAQQLKQLLAPYQIPLIINDDVELAQAVNAEGLHLGQSDANPKRARDILGKARFIGLSIESETELELANHYDLDYVAASAVFPSEHKRNLKTIWGLDGLTSLCQKSHHPMIAIGGIDQHNAEQVIQTGAQGIAVIGALHQAKDPEKMATTLRRIADNRSSSHDR